MKKLLIGFIILILILVGAALTLKFLKIGPFEETAQEAPDPAQVAAERAEREKPTFVSMEPLVINVLDGDQVAANFQFEIKIEVQGTENASKVRKLERRLKDAFIKDLHAFVPRLLKQTNELDLVVLQQRLRLISNQIAEPGIVQDVLIQSAIDSSR